MDHETLKRNLQMLRDTGLKLSTQLENLNTQEQAELSQLAQMGVTDLEASISSADSEIAQIGTAVDACLKALEVAR